MRKLKLFLSVIFALVLFSSICIAGDTILTCKFEELSSFYYDDGKLNGELNKEQNPNPVIFAGLDTKSPVMKGNMGETPLTILMQNSDAIWLAEAPPLGGLNLWTIFKKQKIAIQSKQYSMLGKPFGLMSMGWCE